jgi:hypothetical protein
MAPNVLFCGEVRPGTRGPHVVAYKHALGRTGYLKWPKSNQHFTDYCGPHMIHAILGYKDHHKLDNVPMIGRVMHERLERTHRRASKTEWAFDAYAINTMAAYYKSTHESPEHKIRREIVAAARYWYTVRSQINYDQLRPYPHLKPPNIPHLIDCSAYATLCYYSAEAKDPNGRGYDGQGYTGTLLRYGRRCTYSELQPGDLIFYGYTTSPSPAFNYGDPTHVAVFEGHDTDAVYSMGSSIGPLHLPAHYRSVNCYVTYDVTP